MRSKLFVAVLVTLAFILYTVPLWSAEPTDACALLTQARLSSVASVSMGTGSPISRPGTCQWAGSGKIVTLTITLTKGGKTPVDQFNEGKKSTLPGIAVEPISGVGDDAYYVSYGGNTSAGLGLVVKKGSSSFEFRVYGFKDQSKTVAKTLALEIVPKF
jgi:hypothetical protein